MDLKGVRRTRVIPAGVEPKMRRKEGFEGAGKFLRWRNIVSIALNTGHGITGTMNKDGGDWQEEASRSEPAAAEEHNLQETMNNNLT